MSTQQDIYAAGFENRPPMPNKENYVPWSSRLLRYAKSRPNGKLIHNSIINGPYVRRMIPEPDIYVAVDSCETTQEIWLRVQQMRKGPDIGIQEKKAKLFNEWERIQNVGNQNGQIVVPGNANQNPNGNGNLVAARAGGNATGHNGNQIRCYNYRGVGHFARNCTVRPMRRDAAYLQTQLLIAQKEEAGIQLQAEEFDLMVAVADLDEIEEVNANCILMANLQQESTSDTQTDKALFYDSDGSTEVHNNENCYDNEIFNMFTQEEQYTELIEPIPEPHQVPHNDNNVISEVFSVEQNRETVEQHPVNVEETRVLYDSLYYNLAIEVDKVNKVNRKLSETNAELTTELARYKNQERINALHLSFGKHIMTLNEEISDLSKQLSVEKSTVSSLLEEKKKLKSDFKIHEDELLDKQIIHKKKIKELDNILVKTGVDNTKTRRPQPRSNTKNDRVPSASKYSRSKNKEVELEEHHRKLLLSKNKKHMSSECNNVKLATQNGKSKVVCTMCKQCLISVNHDACLLNYVNGMTSRGKKQQANVSINENQKKQKPKVKKTKKVGSIKRLALPKPSKPRSFLRSKDETPYVIKTFLKRITVLFQSPVIIIRTDNDTKFKNQVLKEYFDSVGISHQVSSVRTPQQNGVVERRNRTLVEAARKMALCYPKNDREDIGKLGAKGDIGFFIGYSADSYAFRVYNRRTKKIMETMNVSFDELSAMAFEQRSSKPGLQSMTSGQITMYDDYIGGQPSTAPQIVPAAQAHQIHQTLTTSTSIADTAPTPTNSSSQATIFANSSQDVDRLNSQQQHAQQQGNQAPILTEIVPDNVLNAMFDANTFVNPFATPSTSAAESSSLQYVDPSNMHTFYQPYPHEFQWTKDHPLEQVIGEPSRPVLIRNQLRSDGDMCMYALTVSSMEPKNVKEAMTDPAWIESMQEELLQFKRLDVWVLVPAPDNITPLTLKWLFKYKHDEEKRSSKTCLV
nr:hypothetical protein [Tanacetum cinerariifolium]